MPLPASWVDHLFAKLSVRWGAAFLRQWPDTDPALVKADWAEVLDGFDGDSLAYALRYLPMQPCNAMQFRDICRRSPRNDSDALPAPDVRADPERVAQVMARFRGAPDVSASPAARVVSVLEAKVAAGERLTMAQRSVLEACRSMVPA